MAGYYAAVDQREARQEVDERILAFEINFLGTPRLLKGPRTLHACLLNDLLDISQIREGEHALAVLAQQNQRQRARPDYARFTFNQGIVGEGRNDRHAAAIRASVMCHRPEREHTA